MRFSYDIFMIFASRLEIIKLSYGILMIFNLSHSPFQGLQKVVGERSEQTAAPDKVGKTMFWAQVHLPPSGSRWETSLLDWPTARAKNQQGDRSSGGYGDFCMRSYRGSEVGVNLLYMGSSCGYSFWDRCGYRRCGVAWSLYLEID